MLCEQCHFLFKIKYLIDGPPAKYSRDINGLAASCATCPFCAILFEWLPKAENEVVNPQNANGVMMHYAAKVDLPNRFSFSHAHRPAACAATRIRQLVYLASCISSEI